MWAVIARRVARRSNLHEVCTDRWRLLRRFAPRNDNVGVTRVPTIVGLRASADVLTDRIEQLCGRGEAWALSLVNRRHDSHMPGAQSPERCLRHRVIQQRLVQRRTHNHRRTSPDCLGNHGQRQIVGDAVCEFVERIEAARCEQYHALAEVVAGCARSKYDSTTCAPATSASSRGAITREAFGVGIAMTVETAKSDQAAKQLRTARRRGRATQYQVSNFKTFAASRVTKTHRTDPVMLHQSATVGCGARTVHRG